MNEVIQAMLDRRSCRSYTKEQVKEAHLEEILLAGTYAASGMGRQAAKIIVVQDPQTREWNAVIHDPAVPHVWQDAGFVPEKNLFIYECHIGMAQQK